MNIGAPKRVEISEPEKAPSIAPPKEAPAPPVREREREKVPAR